MLNEKRVKQMVKLAMYESRDGAQELPISEKRKKYYIFINTLESILWMTIAYAIIVLFMGLGFKSFLIAELSMYEKSLIALLVAGLYFLMLFFGIPKARRYYKEKHATAHKNVKQFKKNLAELDRMYQEEDNYGENL